MEIISPTERQNLIPFYLRFIRFFVSFFLKKNTHTNRSINKIEKFSYAILDFPSQNKLWDINTEDLINNLKNQCKEKKEFDFSCNKPFYFVRTTRSNLGLKFGYDLNLIEFCNVDSNLMKLIGLKYKNIKNIAQSVCNKLQEIRNKKLSIKFVKVYHYNSVEHPRPLHFDTPHNYSYKIFFFLNYISDSHGPYSIIPYSHNFFLNKLMRIYNLSSLSKIWLDGNDGSFFKSSDTLQFKELRENNFVVTKQNAIHGDMPSKKDLKKTAIVFHILPD